jgi:hypothetical protein
MEISHSRMEKSHSEWRLLIHAWTIPILNGDFPFTLPILNGELMSILKVHEWTLERDLPVSKWEKMARRPFTSSIHGGRRSHSLFTSTEWR